MNTPNSVTFYALSGLRRLAGITTICTLGVAADAGPLPDGPAYASFPVADIARDPVDLDVADMNGDGHVDLVVLYSRPGQPSRFIWYESDGSSIPAFSPHTLTYTADDPVVDAFTLADLDGDGDVDVIFSPRLGLMNQREQILVLENDGNMNPSFSQDIFDLGESVSRDFTIARSIDIAVGDLNDDGNLDVAAFGTNPDSGPVLAWYRPDGMMVQRRLVATFDINDIPEEFAIADLNGDERLDVVATFTGDSNQNLAWWENDGASPPGFIDNRRVISINRARSESLAVADLDGDGDIDIFLPDEANGVVGWFENDGAASPEFAYQVIGVDAEGASKVVAADLDQDSDTDLLLIDETGVLFGYFNDGAPEPVFVEHRLAEGFRLGRLLATSDLAHADVGGKALEIIAGTFADDRVEWLGRRLVQNTNSEVVFESISEAAANAAPGDTLFAQPIQFGPGLPRDVDLLGPPEVTVESPAPITVGLRSILSLSRNDLLDPLGSPVTVLGRLEARGNNPGTGPTIMGEPLRVAGDLDIGMDTTLVNTNGEVRFEGTLAYKEASIFTDPGGGFSAAKFGDLNGDDRADLVAVRTGEPSPGIVVALRDEANGWTWNVPTGLNADGPVWIDDLDRDGDADLVTAIGKNIIWYQNSGDGLNFAGPFEVGGLVGGGAALRIRTADANGDGWPDVFASAADGMGVILFYSDGAAAPGFLTSITAAPAGPYSDSPGPLFDLADMNRDRIVDVVFNRTDSELVVAFGTSAGVFTMPDRVGFTGGQTQSVEVADLNNDTAPDVLYGRSVQPNSRILRYYQNNRNATPGFSLRQILPYRGKAFRVMPTDFDSDGDVDLLVLDSESGHIEAIRSDGTRPNPTFELIRVLEGTEAATDLIVPEAIDPFDIRTVGTSTTDAAYIINDPVRGFPRIVISHGLSNARVEMMQPGSVFQMNEGGSISEARLMLGIGTQIDLTAGQLAVRPTGVLAGAGAVVNGETRILGTLEPTGSFSVDSLNMSGIAEGSVRTGELAIEVRDSGTPNELLLTGSGSLAGTLEITIPEGFDPPAESSFNVISLKGAGSISATQFDTISLPRVGNEKVFKAVYNPEGPGGTGLGLTVEPLDEDIEIPVISAAGLAGEPTGAVLADVNGDTFPDIVICVPDAVDPLGTNGKVYILFNLGGAGAWSLGPGVDVGRFPTDIGAVDLDGDMDPDIVVTNRVDGEVSALLNDGTASGMLLESILSPFTFNTEPAALTTADFDGDGNDDIAVAGENGSGGGLVTIALNLGDDGNGWLGYDLTLFDFVIGHTPTDIASVDVDQDLDPDLLVANRGNQGVDVLVNTIPRGTTLTFTNSSTVATGTYPAAIDIGDLDNDSCFDFIVADEVGGYLSVVLHETQFTPDFKPAANIDTGEQPSSLALGDYDDDNDLDIAVVAEFDESGSATVGIIRNDLDDSNGQLVFVPTDSLDTIGVAVEVLAGDLDGDGVDDVVAITKGTALGGAPIQERGSGGDDARGVGPTTIAEFGISVVPSAACNAADLVEPFGVLDLGDIGAFIAGFTGVDPISDLNDDGVFDLADIGIFVGEFTAGCP